MTLVPQQDSLCCHTPKTAQEHLKDVYSFDQALECLNIIQTSIHINTKTQGFSVEHCTVAMINIFYLSVVLLLWLIGL